MKKHRSRTTTCPKTPSPRILPLLAALMLHCGSDAEEGDLPDPDRLAALPTVAAWATAPQDASEGFLGMPAPVPSLRDQTIRQLLRVSSGGEGLRVRFSNLYGAEPVTIQAAAVAPSAGSGAIDSAASVALSFGGAPVAMVPPGEQLWSDFAPLSVRAGQELAVSLYVDGEMPVRTIHSVGLQTAYVAPGDALEAASLPIAYATPGSETITLEGLEQEPEPAPEGESQSTPLASYYWITGVDVAGADVAPRVVVAFGDSITDGVGSTVDAYQSYPDLLAEQLDADGPRRFAVVNVGISANRVLNDGIGQRGVERFGRDVLGQTGVSDVIILLGINDIGFGGFNPDQSVEPSEITAGLAAMIAEANAAGVQVRLGTLTPLEGTNAPYYSEESETKRGAVNEWIRANPDVASVVDFDRVIQDPERPLAMLPSYDSGDNLHPGDEGYRAMAAAVAADLAP